MNPDRRPIPAQVDTFLEMVEAEFFLARKKFPAPNCSTVALMEEVGELAKALLSEPWINVQNEAIQVAALAARIAIEGDPTLYPWRDRNPHTSGEPKKLRSQDFTPRSPEYRMERFAELRAQYPDLTHEAMLEALHEAEIDDQCDI